MYVSLLLDAEDFIGPKEPDAVRDVAELLTSLGLRATFCVVGELARRLDREGRGDVLRALEPHDIGLHTDLHSVHPTTCEALEGLDWDDGVEVMLGQNRPGVEAIERVFGRKPSCWGGAGNTWGPQVVGALEELCVPAFVYAHTAPPGSDVHEFDGLTAYGSGLYLGDWLLLDRAALEDHHVELHDVLGQRIATGVEWCEVFVCHPCVLRTVEFWDGVNFAHGTNPPQSKWRSADLRPETDYRTMLANLRWALERLTQVPGIRFATIDEMNARAKTAKREALSGVELQELQAIVRGRLMAMKNWPIHHPNLDVSSIAELTIERLGTVRRLTGLAGAAEVDIPISNG